MEKNIPVQNLAEELENIVEIKGGEHHVSEKLTEIVDNFEGLIVELTHQIDNGL